MRQGVNVGTPVRIDFLTNDTDADARQGMYGTDSFSYRATDGDAPSGVAMVSVTVQKVNRAPTAQSASFQVQKDGSVLIDFDCLVNDPDGDVLTLSLTDPSKGSLKRNGDGSYMYRPKSGFIGTDGFAYSVSDGKLSASATITLVVSKNPPCGNAMSIVLGASVSAGSVQGGGYIVVNLGASAPQVIDWSGTATLSDAAVTGDRWTAYRAGRYRAPTCWRSGLDWSFGEIDRSDSPFVGRSRHYRYAARRIIIRGVHV